MEKLQVRLMVLLIFGTISKCEEVDGPHFDRAEVLTSSPLTPPLGCGPPKTVKVRFNEIKVMGDGSDVVYHRVTVTDWHLQFAMNASVSLPGDSFVQCAKAAARKGLEAFVFKENCTGYQLNYGFLKCQWGDLVVFVRADSFAKETAVVSFDEAPYTVIDNGVDRPYRLYMLSAIVEVADDQVDFTLIDEFYVDSVSEDSWNIIFLESGDLMMIFRMLLDVNFCLNDGAHGLPIAVSFELYDFTWPILYFFKECGKTFKVTTANIYSYMLVFSHPGFGCKYYPSDLPDECTVIFDCDDPINARHGFYFPESNSDGAGLIMTIAATNTNNNATTTTNMYESSGNNFLKGYNTFNFSLQRQPSKRAVGFFIELF